MVFKILPLCITVSLLVVGCSSTHTPKFKKAQARVEKQFKTDFEEKLSDLKQKKESSGRIHYGNAYHNIDDYMVIERDNRNLPKQYYKKTLINTKNETMTIDEFSALLYKGYGIVFDVSSPELDILSSRRAVNGSVERVNNVHPLNVPNNITSDSAGNYSDIVDLITPKKEKAPRDALTLKPFKYKGDIIGLLDYISIYNGLKWKYNGDLKKSYLFAYETKEFFIYDFSSDSEQKITISNTSKQQSESTTGGSSKQFSIKEKIEPWKNVVNTIKALKSEHGTMSFNQKSGMIVITDNDYTLSRVNEIVKKLNKTSTKEITVQYRMIRLKYNNNNNNDVNISFLNNALKNKLFGGFSLAGGLGSLSPNISGNLGTLQQLSSGNYLTLANKSFKGLLGFLNSVGTTKIAYETHVNILNDNTYTYQGGKNKEYISSIQRTSVFGNNSQDNVTTKTDTAVDGINISFKPRIVGDRVFLKYSVSNSDFEGLDDAGLGVGLEGVKLKRDSSLDLNNTALLENGETRVIEIVQESKEDTHTQGIIDDALWFLGGNEQRNSTKTMLIVTISASYNN